MAYGYDRRADNERDVLLHTMAMRTVTVGPLPVGKDGQAVFIVEAAPPVQAWVWVAPAWVRLSACYGAPVLAEFGGAVTEGELHRKAPGTVCRWMLSEG